MDPKSSDYFKALGNSRGSVSMLRLAWAGLLLLFINWLPLYNEIYRNQELPLLYEMIHYIIIVLFLISLFALVLSFQYEFTYKHQALFTFVLFLVTVSMFFGIMMIFSNFIIFPNLTYDFNQTSLIRAWTVWMLEIIGLSFTIFYNLRWMKRQLTFGFSSSRTDANKESKSRAWSRSSLWIILGFVILGSGVLMRSFLAMISVLVLIIIIGAFSRLFVELAFLTYLRFKNKEFWEKIPKEVIGKTIWTVFSPRNTRIRLIYEAIIWVILRGVLLPKIGFHEVDRPDWVNWLAISFYAVIGCDYVLSFIWYLVKKRRNRKEWRK